MRQYGYALRLRLSQPLTAKSLEWILTSARTIASLVTSGSSRPSCDFPSKTLAALAYLSVIDSEAFEIAFTAVAQAPDDPEDEAPIPLCATCGAPVGIFPKVILDWRHFRGAAAASGAHQTYDPGHAFEVAWYLEDEVAEEF